MSRYDAGSESIEEMKLDEQSSRESPLSVQKITIYGEMRMKDIMQEGWKDREAREGRGKMRAHRISLF